MKRITPHIHKMLERRLLILGDDIVMFFPFKEIDFSRTTSSVAVSNYSCVSLYVVRFGFYPPFMNLLNVGYFKTEENVTTDSEIIIAALQLPSLPVRFVLPVYQLLSIVKVIQVCTFLHLLSYCIVSSALLV